MTEPQLIVILARQRSGTTALAETLALGADVCSFGEVFHHQQPEVGKPGQPDLRLHPEADFFKLSVEMLRSAPELALPSVENKMHLFDAFISHLSSLTRSRWILIDVKYNSWHHFENYYHVPGHSPFLLHLLKHRNAAFIHVTRANTFARYCSEQLALSRNKWHVERGAKDDDAAIIIDPVAALRDMQETQRQMETFSRFLTDCRRRIDLRYEEIFAGDHLASATDAKISRLLDGDWTAGVTVPLQKATPPLSSVIKNLDEVRSYFEFTTHREEVLTALAEP